MKLTKEDFDEFLSLPKEMRVTWEYGHKCYISNEGYRYFDSDELLDPSKPKPCKFCGLEYTEKCDEGRYVDPCLGKLPGIKYACCGHGQIEAYLAFENGKVLRFNLFSVESGFFGKKDDKIEKIIFDK